MQQHNFRLLAIVDALVVRTTHTVRSQLTINHERCTHKNDIFLDAQMHKVSIVFGKDVERLLHLRSLRASAVLKKTI